MNKERMELWLAALESNEYPQCYGKLLTFEGSTRKLCAIGVGIAVFCRENGIPLPSDANDTFRLLVFENNWADRAAAWYEVPRLDLEILHDGELTDVIDMNDSLRVSFADIAQWIRKMYF